MKKIISMILVFVLAFALMVPSFAAGEDAGMILIAPNPNAAAPAWYDEYIGWARENELFGEDKGPDALITRSDFFNALWLYAKTKGIDVSVGEDTNILSFDDAFDIKEGYFSCFQWACGAGLINGSAVTELRPADVMTREEMIGLLLKFAILAEVDVSVGEDTNILSFDDVFDISEGYFEGFQWACGAGLINGVGAATLAPQQNPTFAQLSTLLMRFDSLCMAE